MLQWIMENHGVVSAAASVLMLLVWLVYLQLFLRSYKHQLRPTVLINRAGGRTMHARCMVTNMSYETVYVDVVIFELRVNGRMVEVSLSDIDRLASGDVEERPDPRSNMFQGPLESGNYLDLGTFADLLHIALIECSDDPAKPEDVEEITLTILGTYTWSDIAVARRSFLIESREGVQTIRARSGGTEQVTSWYERRRYQRFLEEHDSS